MIEHKSRIDPEMGTISAKVGQGPMH
jgi:hypothetical protein